MKNKLVVVPPLKTLIQPSGGFAKKLLSEFKIDLMALCGFGCSYCSSNTGNFLRINREAFATLTEEQLGERLLPTTHPELTMEYPDVVASLSRELDAARKKNPNFGAGKVLMVSMLTDAFSPRLVSSGVTRAALDLLLAKTKFRLRILTKNAIVGTADWVDYFSRHRDRVVVGLSIGTLDSEWASRVELGTSHPQARIRALRALQDAGVPTYGMLCPVFPDVMVGGHLDDLIDAIRPERCEHVWSEPYNDRANWRVVRDAYPEGSPTREWMDEAFGTKNSPRWGEYAIALYDGLRRRAEADGWLSKLRYMLYEAALQPGQSEEFRDLQGLLLQSPKSETDGLSQDPHFRELEMWPGGVEAETDAAPLNLSIESAEAPCDATEAIRNVDTALSKRRDLAEHMVAVLRDAGWSYREILAGCMAVAAE